MSKRWQPSVTVAGIIEQTIDGASRFLLVEEETPEGLRLNNPSGYLDEGESPEEGVVREVLEETARAFTPQCLLGVYLSRFQRASTGRDVTYLRFAFAGQVGEAIAGRALDKGIVRTLWMTLDELRANRVRHRGPLVMRCIEDYVAGRRYPLQVLTVDPTLYDPEIVSGSQTP